MIIFTAEDDSDRSVYRIRMCDSKNTFCSYVLHDEYISTEMDRMK